MDSFKRQTSTASPAEPGGLPFLARSVYASLQKTLRRNAATDDVYVSLENRLVAIAIKPETDIADEVLRKALKDAGYDVKAIARTERSLQSLREQLKARK